LSEWQTPQTADGTFLNCKSNVKGIRNVRLSEQVRRTRGNKQGTEGKDSGLWPTPTCQEVEHPEMILTESGRRKTKDGKNSHSVGLADRAHWPTPAARDYKGQNSVETMTRKLSERKRAQQGQLPNAIAMQGQKGQLNPDWVEWLMGWPISWTSLDPTTDLIWLDWSVDPADVESDRMWRSPVDKETGRMAQLGVTQQVQLEAKQAQRWPTPTDSMVTVGDMEQARFAGNDPDRPKYADANKVKSSQGIIPRVATGIKDRVARLKAIGNGQVPQVAATAWEVLKP